MARHRSHPSSRCRATNGDQGQQYLSAPQACTLRVLVATQWQYSASKKAWTHPATNALDTATITLPIPQLQIDSKPLAFSEYLRFLVR